jgi:hypothetical protein
MSKKGVVQARLGISSTLSHPFLYKSLQHLRVSFILVVHLSDEGDSAKDGTDDGECWNEVEWRSGFRSRVAG